MERFRCPICGAERPEDYHLDWCEYEGPDFGDDSDEGE